MTLENDCNRGFSIHDFVPQSKLDIEAVQREIEAGYINTQQHPTAPLKILNYSQLAQLEWRWNAETMQCRGLIVDDLWKVISRPFQKFFAYDQLNGAVPCEPFDAYEKLDGSLGITYQVEGKTHIASRGSFTSDQAQRATTIYHRKYSHIPLDERLTYLFEIIYPENRIVIDYGTTEDLFLLAILETETGREMPLADIGFPIVKRYDGINDFAELLAAQDGTREGFVVRFQSGQRVKIKFDEYKRLHELMTGVSPMHIWEVLRCGDDLRHLVERVPDEYFDWVRRTESNLRNQFETIEANAKTEFSSLSLSGTRKEAALEILKSRHPQLLFAMLDNKPYANQIWRMIKPSSHPVFRCDMDK